MKASIFGAKQLVENFVENIHQGRNASSPLAPAKNAGLIEMRPINPLFSMH